MAKLLNPTFNPDPWITFLVHQLITVTTYPFYLFERLLVLAASGTLFFCLASPTVVFVALLSFSPTKQTAKTVFINFDNTSCWPISVVFCLSIMNAPDWCFSCLDAAVHLAEEKPELRKNLPRALLWIISVGTATGLPMMLAVLFSVHEMNEAINNSLRIVCLALFLPVSGRKAGAITLQVLVLLITMATIIRIHAWQSRMAWAFARNNGFSFHRYLAAIAPAPFHTQIWAHLWSCIWASLIGAVYLGP